MKIIHAQHHIYENKMGELMGRLFTESAIHWHTAKNKRNIVTGAFVDADMLVSLRIFTDGTISVEHAKRHAQAWVKNGCKVLDSDYNKIHFWESPFWRGDIRKYED